MIIALETDRHLNIPISMPNGRESGPLQAVTYWPSEQRPTWAHSG